MYLFQSLQIALDIGSSLNFKKKSELRKKIVENGGTISYIVTSKCNFVATNDPEKCDISSKCHMAIKYRLPVLHLDYIWDSLQAEKLLPYDSYVVGGKSKIQDFKSGKISGFSHNENGKKYSCKAAFNPRSVKVWSSSDLNQPTFNETKHEVAKYAIFMGFKASMKCQYTVILELHTASLSDAKKQSKITLHETSSETQFNYRVVSQIRYHKDLESDKQSHTEARYTLTAEQALAVFAMLYEDTSKKSDVIKYRSPIRGIGSKRLQELMAEVVDVNNSCSEEVKALVEHVWSEAMMEVTSILGDIKSVKLEDVKKAEAILVKVRDAIKSSAPEKSIQGLIDDFYSTLHHKNESCNVDDRKRWLVKKQDMCQLIKDLVTVSEMTHYETRAYAEAKYAALRCRITHLSGDQRNQVEELIKSSMEGSTEDLSVINVYEVWRGSEDLDFRQDLDRKQLLFHSSKVENFVGILSRGLLLPKVVVDDFGGKRSDPGMLGSGIYFASSASTSVKYSSPSNTKGSRLLLINEVALGCSKDYTTHDTSLVIPPEGFNSTHGICKKLDKSSQFENDEFVVYSINQQRIRYLVEFTIKGDQLRPLEEICSVDSNILCDAMEKTSLQDVTDITDPILKVKPGLISTGDDDVDLQCVHIRAKLVDLAAQVVVLQEYYNNSQHSVEAKYVFPLDDTAAVCGFEAFINGKHIVGEVKEKETAHKEYKKAINEGHGAYLMDQDEETHDVFVVSVGNLPPGACVLIKITYVSELQLDDEQISFILPATVAPWKEDSALKQSTQAKLKRLKLTSSKTTIQVAIEMPFNIRHLHSPTHKIKIKQTSSKAYVELMNNQNFETRFQLLIGLAEIHVPRMWVERDPLDPEHQACMLAFYPEFKSEDITEGEICLFLDTSNSMKGTALSEAKKVALLVLQNLPCGWHFNVVKFGSDHEELFPAPKINMEENLQLAIDFVQNSVANQGNTDFMRSLHSVFLLPHSQTQRNVFLISDGHISNEDLVCRSASQNSRYTRLFSFGISSNCNTYTLKTLSHVSGGAFEFFDNRVKSKWESKVKNQISRACQPGLTSVAVEWHQYNEDLPMPVQAPKMITALFSGSHQIVYGFVPNCTMATLKANIDGQEVSTVVSTSELSITEGQLIHRLTARAVIRDWNDGILSRDRTEHEVAKMDLKNYVIDLSKKYSIVTEFTSFIAVENRDENEKDFVRTGPSIEELVAKENLDFLNYMDWTKLPSDKNLTEIYCHKEDTDNKSVLAETANKVFRSSLSNEKISEEQALDKIVENQLPLSTSLSSFERILEKLHVDDASLDLHDFRVCSADSTESQAWTSLSTRVAGLGINDGVFALESGPVPYCITQDLSEYFKPQAPSEGGFTLQPPLTGGFTPQTASKGSFTPQLPTAGGFVPRLPTAGGFIPQPPSAGGFIPQPSPAGGFIPQLPSAGGFIPQLPPKGFASQLPSAGGFIPQLPPKGFASQLPSAVGFIPRLPSAGSFILQPPAAGGFIPQPSTAGGFTLQPPSNGGFTPQTASKGGFAPQLPTAGGFIPQPPSTGGFIPWLPSADGFIPQLPPKGFASQLPSAVGFIPRLPSAGDFVPQPPTAGGFIPQPPTAGGFIPQPPSTGGFIPWLPSAGGFIPQLPPKGFASQLPSAVGFIPRLPSAGDFVPQPPTAGGFIPQPPTAGGFIPRSSFAHGFIPQSPFAGGFTPQLPSKGFASLVPSAGGFIPQTPFSFGLTPQVPLGFVPQSNSTGGFATHAPNASLATQLSAGVVPQVPSASFLSAAFNLFGSVPSAPSNLFGNAPSEHSPSFGSASSATSQSLGSASSKPSQSFESAPSATSNLFGSAPSTTSNLFGSSPSATSNLFGSTPSAPSNLFGSSPSATSNLFGSAPSATSQSLGSASSKHSLSFGSVPSTHSSMFGSAPSVFSSSVGSAPSVFSSSVGSAPSAPSPSFGSAPSATSNLFGSAPSAPSNLFGSAASGASQLFGSALSGPIPSLGIAPSAPSNLYGSTPSASTPSFVSAPSAPSNSFGNAPSEPSPSFGSASSATSQSLGSASSKPSLSFGSVPSTHSSTLGSAPSTHSSTFGSAPSATSNLFGSAPSATSNLFGSSPSATSDLFGSAPSATSNLFGSAPSATSNLFGSAPSAPSNLFGSAASGTSQLFGSAPSAPSNLFGGAPSVPSQLFGSAPSAPSNLFGGAPSAPSQLFGSAPSAPSNLFGGAPSVFSPSVGSAPSAPSPSFASAPSATSNLFGSAPSATSNLFGSAPSAPSNLFGSAASGASQLFGSALSGPVPSFGSAPSAPSNLYGSAPSASTPSFVSAPSTPSNLFGNAPSEPSPSFGSASSATSQSLGSASSKPSLSFGSVPSTHSSTLGSAPSTHSSTFGSAPSATSNLFGSAPSATSDLFGSSPSATSDLFGSAPSATSNLFGSAPSATSNLFGSAPSAPSNLFGSAASGTSQLFGGAPSAPTPSFGSAPSATSPVLGNVPSVFSPSVGSAPSAPSNLFGSAASGASQLFGSAPSAPTPSFESAQSAAFNLFGSAPSAPSNLFGGAPSVPSQLFGSAPSAPSNLFGGAPSVFSPSVGSAPSAPSPSFGSAPSATSNLFGSAPSATSNLFGSAPSAPSNLFGSAASGASQLFGSALSGPVPSFGSAPSAPSNLYGSAPSASTPSFVSAPSTPSNLFGNAPSKPSLSFGSVPSTHSSTLGSAPSTHSSTFGSAPSATSNLFGSAPSATSNLFGSAPSATSQSLGSASSKHSLSFGSVPSTHSSTFGSAPSVFSPSVGSAPSATSNLFGSAPSATSNLFGSAPSAPSNLFGIAASGASQLFGSALSGPIPSFGSAPSAPSNSFGNAPSEPSPSFGSASSATSQSLGSASSKPSLSFGSVPSTHSSTLGSAPSATSNLFGSSPSATSDLFGSAPSATSNLFGSAPSAPSNLFGSAASGASQLFGSAPSAPTPSFGSAPSATSNLFGSAPSAPSNLFGSAPSAPSQLFGSAPSASTPSFESAQSAPSNVFGSALSAPSALSGSAPSAPSPSFGSAQSEPFALFGSAPSAPSNLFGSAASTPSNLFGSAASGASQLFGSAPSAPTPSFESAQSAAFNLFGSALSGPIPSFVSAPSAPSNLFGGAPSAPSQLFGSAPSAPSNLFGGAPSVPSQLFGNAPSTHSQIFRSAPSAPSQSFGNAPSFEKSKEAFENASCMLASHREAKPATSVEFEEALLIMNPSFDRPQSFSSDPELIGKPEMNESLDNKLSFSFKNLHENIEPEIADAAILKSRNYQAEDIPNVLGNKSSLKFQINMLEGSDSTVFTSRTKKENNDRLETGLQATGSYSCHSHLLPVIEGILDQTLEQNKSNICFNKKQMEISQQNMEKIKDIQKLLKLSESSENDVNNSQNMIFYNYEEGNASSREIETNFDSRLQPVVGGHHQLLSESKQLPPTGVFCIRAKGCHLKVHDLDKLIHCQKDQGCWDLSGNLDDVLSINCKQCQGILKSSGLHSLGVTATEQIEQLVATILVLFSILELIMPENFPIDSQLSLELSHKFLEITDVHAWTTLSLKFGFLKNVDLVEVIEKAYKFCHQIERLHPLVYSSLELGTNWINVASAFLQPHSG